MMRSNTYLKLIIILAVCCLLMGCSSRTEGGEGSTTDEVLRDTLSETDGQSETVYDPFSQTVAGESTEETEEYNGGGINAGADMESERGKRCIVYEGGEAELPVEFSVSGYEANCLGLVLYVNGIPHPYRIEGLEPMLLEEEKSDCGELLYIHQLTPRDGKEIRCTLRFTPLVGKKGEILEICCGLVTHTRKTKSDIGYTRDQRLYTVERDMVYEADAPMASYLYPEKELLSGVGITTVEMTDDLKLEYTLYFNGNTKWDYFPMYRYWVNGVDKKLGGNLTVSEDTVHIRLEVLGASLIRYRAIVYLNHEPLNIGEENQIKLNLQQGEITVLEFDVDVSEVEEETPFYLVLVAENYWEMSELDAIPEAQKTETIWLKHSEQ